MTDPRDMEALASLEHESWSGWTKWMLQEMTKAHGGDFELEGLPCVERWTRQMTTPYAELSEREKESDRKVVREKLPLYRGDTQIFRSSVEILVWNDFGKLLTVTNRRWGGFSCPGGKVDPGESLLDAARRELKEETGCEPVMLEPIGAGVHYEEPKDGGPPWFCMAYRASINTKPTQQEEGTEIGWHTPKELIDNSIYPEWYKFLFRLMPEVKL
jgi:8-oxo-dGTP pyrophosphatase MutT (NUDIX family)